MTSKEKIAEIRKNLAPKIVSFDVPPGWLDIIYKLHLQLVDRYPDYQILQVKQKFGGLRYYVTGVDEDGRKLINFTESMSYYVCEKCGTTLDLRDEGFTTICDTCWKLKTGENPTTWEKVS